MLHIFFTTGGGNRLDGVDMGLLALFGILLLLVGGRNPALFHDDGNCSSGFGTNALYLIFFFRGGVPGGLDGRGIFVMVSTSLGTGLNDASG